MPAMSVPSLGEEPAECGSDDAIEVLYLERDPELAEMYQLKLQLDGYRVRTSPLHKGAKAHLASPAPALLFVDVGSAIREGLDSLATWRADAQLRQTPAVIISTVSARKLRDQGILLGPADELLVIPEPLQPH